MSPRANYDGEVGVWTGGRWRPLQASGRISGFRRARFVMLQGGALCAVRADAVMRALHAGQLQLGPKLPKRRPPHRCRQTLHPPPAQPPSPPLRQHIKVEPLLHTADSYVATTSTKPDAISNFADSTAKLSTPTATAKIPSATSKIPSASPKIPSEPPKILSEPPKIPYASSPAKATTTSRKSVSFSSTSSSDADSGDKVLMIDDKQVSLVRRALAATIDKRRFDHERAYTRAVLYSVQPLVHVRPSPHIARMVRRGARTVRLAHTTQPRASGGTDATPARHVAHGKLKSKRAGAGVGARVTDAAPSYPVLDAARVPSPVRRRRRRHILYRPCSRPGREYSALEDQAIVAWLSASAGRERAVNGNRVWRELQADYRRLTGQTRSWHSLRNRYLRYLLPSLGALALPDAHAQRLRAAAADGELKARRRARAATAASTKPAAPPQLSAWAQRNRARPPRSPSTPPTSPSPPPASPPVSRRVTRRSLRQHASSAAVSPAPAAPAPATYSALTRRYATRTTRSPDTPADTPEGACSTPTLRPRRRRLYPLAV